MGKDDLFHKRKAKKIRDLTRRKIKRASYAKMLIVCEGEKTERNYFEEIIRYYELNSANVEIADHHGTDPMGILNHAKARYQRRERCR
uniref:RloB-like protein n=1 Tax=Candidatus Kentrum sp. TUN TaxID=2126343 RepID=A0A450ZF49_9GAMM|nr:MAG: RloB-like protein [Candidatus Kentron sp. TUN]VFK52913.1 MAG: RloB-like protein [Candidatus Kentron sp. TUN]